MSLDLIAIGYSLSVLWSLGMIPHVLEGCMVTTESKAELAANGGKFSVKQWSLCRKSRIL